MTGVAVIGGGPAGYVVAIRAAQLGAKVTLIEEKRVGGVCLNCGCLPTKFLLHSVGLYHEIQTGAQYGIDAPGASLDFAALMAGKQRTVAKLVAGVEGLLEANGVTVRRGRARLVSPTQIEVSSGEAKETIPADRVILATGARAVRLPVPGAGSPAVLDYEGLLSLDHVPKSAVIVGGGVVGVEMATVLNRLGCKVTIIEMLPHILPAQDAEVVAVLDSALRRDGVDVFCRARVERIGEDPAGKVVTFTLADQAKEVKAEIVAVCVGQQPNAEGLGLEPLGVTVEKGRVRVNERLETGVPGVYAAGDVTGGMMLAHVAFAQGKAAAENAMGGGSAVDLETVPQCIYTAPEVASVGLTEEAAVAGGFAVSVGRFPFAANAMADVLGESRGLVKIVTETKYNRILGVHIVGPLASALIAEAVLAMKMELTPAEIAATVHAHPTLSEALWEASLDITGEAIHYVSRRRRARG